jgi:NAD+ synthase
MTPLPHFDPVTEKNRIVTFLKDVIKKTHIKNVIIAVSGGIDSATSLNLLCESIGPEHVYAVHFPYFDNTTELFHKTVEPLGISENHSILHSIKDLSNTFTINLSIGDSNEEKLRKGNIMARIRMILLYDYAKKYNALVCGTENRSEMLLGYFTRFGDAASDIEPISHLYKTQIRLLARELGVPREVLQAAPTAGLWDGQTDEGELGFTYEEADQVLYQFFDKKIQLADIDKSKFPHADKIIVHAQSVAFKHEVPYHL